MNNRFRGALIPVVFASFVSLSLAAPPEPEDRLTTGLRNTASATSDHMPQSTPARISVEAKIVRIPGDSSFVGDKQTFPPSSPNPLATGTMTAEQLAMALQSITGHQQGEVIYAKKFVTSNGRGITISAEEVAAKNSKGKGEAFGLWFTPVIEGKSVRLFAGVPAEGSKAATAVAFEAQSPVSVPNNNSLLFSTRDSSQPQGTHYLIILTPAIVEK